MLRRSRQHDGAHDGVGKAQPRFERGVQLQCPITDIMLSTCESALERAGERVRDADAKNGQDMNSEAVPASPPLITASCGSVHSGLRLHTPKPRVHSVIACCR